MGQFIDYLRHKEIKYKIIKILLRFYACQVLIYLIQKGTVPPLYPIAIIRRRARLVTCESGLYRS